MAVSASTEMFVELGFKNDTFLLASEQKHRPALGLWLPTPTCSVETVGYRDQSKEFFLTNFG